LIVEMQEKKNTIKVLIVDDSAFMRKIIADIISSDSTIEVVGIAKNGAEALEKVKSLKPDVITLDVEMPVMDGLTCLKEILKISRIPVIMLSSFTKEGADATIKALELGAVDFIPKPTNIFEQSGQETIKEIISKIKIARNIKVLEDFKAAKTILDRKTVVQPTQKGTEINTRKGTERQTSVTSVPKTDSNIAAIRSNIKYVVTIGTSTGGPRALQEVIPLIPADIPAAIFVVQHMPEGFTKSLAERLDSMSKVRVKEAEDGETAKAGYVYIAPGGYHMEVRCNNKTLKIKLTKDPPIGGLRPSVDVMMESVANTGFKNIIAVIMTGMGGDGSKGIVKIKEKNNGYVIAQDEKTCVVYGMPRMAVKTGVVDTVVPLGEIANEIVKHMGVY